MKRKDVIGSDGTTAPESCRRVNCGRIDMRICRDGKWLYHGTPIPRKEMVCLFASTLTRRDDGSFWLVTPGEEAEIEVDDVPFLAVELFVSGAGRAMELSFRTNVDEVIALNTDHPLRLVAGCKDSPPYIPVRSGLEARLTRSVYYQVVSLCVEEAIANERLYGVWSSGTFFPLGPAED